jgi:hypothetical protein
MKKYSVTLAFSDGTYSSGPTKAESSYDAITNLLESYIRSGEFNYHEVVSVTAVEIN